MDQTQRGPLMLTGMIPPGTIQNLVRHPERLAMGQPHPELGGAMGIAGPGPGDLAHHHQRAPLGIVGAMPRHHQPGALLLPSRPRPSAGRGLGTRVVVPHHVCSTPRCPVHGLQARPGAWSATARPGASSRPPVLRQPVIDSTESAALTTRGIPERGRIRENPEPTGSRKGERQTETAQRQSGRRCLPGKQTGAVGHPPQLHAHRAADRPAGQHLAEHLTDALVPQDCGGEDALRGA